MTHMDLKIGHMKLVDRLGKGGMGAVYVGYDEKLKREVAIKAVRSDRLDTESRARFLREARVLSRLDHPNICRIYDYMEEEHNDYLVLELVKGRSLREALNEGIGERRSKLEIAEQIAQALAAAHAEGIVHRDLKPANVMLTGDGIVKVLDFGLARFLDYQSGDWQTEELAPVDESFIDRSGTMPGSPLTIRTERGAVLGTASCMSPEQARGEPVTAASDMYSLGLLLQELFTGRPPYEPGQSRHLVLLKAARGDHRPITGLAADLTLLVHRLQSLSPEARPTAAETAQRLRRIRKQPRMRLWRLAAAIAVVVLVAAGFKYTQDLRQERDGAVAARQEAELERGRANAALAATLIQLGRVDEARPLVDRLLAEGWSDPEFLELCRTHFLLPKENE